MNSQSTDKQLNVLLRFALDQAAITRVKSGVSSIEDELVKSNLRLAKMSDGLREVSQGAQKAGKAFQGIFVAGTAITGGIFAAAQRYVSSAKEATETTRAWSRETLEVTKAQERIGEVLAQESLPLLKKAADLASAAADFVEQNPEVVQAALKTGLVLAGLGAVGVAVTKGIKLVADASQIAVAAQQVLAGKMMQEAATKQLAAAGAGKLGGGGALGTAAGGGVLATLGTIAATLAAIAGGVAIGGLGYDQYAKATGGARLNTMATGGAYVAGQALGSVAQKFGMSPEEAERKALVFAGLIGKLTGAIDEASPLWQKAAAAVKQAATEIEGAANKLSGSQFEEQIVKAFTQMREQEIEAAKQYEAQRSQIIQQANRQIQEIARSHGMAMVDIQRNYSKQVESITANYQKSGQQSEANYAEQRAQVVRDGGVAIQEIEKNHQEELRRLTEEHNARVEDLVGRRDALGLIREMRAFDKSKGEAERNANQEIASRRRDLAVRLSDMARQHAQERALRLTEYKDQLKQAAQQASDSMMQQNQQYAEQMRRAQQAKADSLRELDARYREESQRRRSAFVAYVKDLDASLLNEQNQKRRYYATMLKDAEAFLAAYRTRMPSGGNAGAGLPVKDTGGYAGKGVYALAQNGQTEFVLAGQTTKAAEQAIGQKLTQENVLAALTQSRGGLTVYDHRRFDSRLSADDRRAIQADTMETLRNMVMP